MYGYFCWLFERVEPNDEIYSAQKVSVPRKGLIYEVAPRGGTATASSSTKVWLCEVRCEQGQEASTAATVAAYVCD